MGLNPANIGRTLEGIGRRLRLLVDRAVVRIVTDSLGRQNLQIQSLADSTNDDVERFQNYGLDVCAASRFRSTHSGSGGTPGRSGGNRC